MVMIGALATRFEKSATELKPKTKLFICKIIQNCPLNDWTLNTVNHLSELRVSANKHNIDTICMQDHRFYHNKVEMKYIFAGNGVTFDTLSAGKNPINTVIGYVGMLLSFCSVKSLNSIAWIKLRMMCASFHGNLGGTQVFKS